MVGLMVMLEDGRMSTRAAAEYLGVSVKTLAMKRCAGTGPPFVKMGRVFYYRADLDQWLMSRRVSSTAEARQRAASGSQDET